MKSHEREDEDGEAGFNPERIVSALRRRWRLVATVTTGAVGLAILVAVLLPNRYEAAATIQLDPRKKNISNIEGVVSDFTVDTVAIESETEVIRSRHIILKVIDKLDLRNDPEFTTPPLWKRVVDRVTSMSANALEKAIELPAAVDPAKPRRDELAYQFAQQLEVRRVRNTLLIEIKFTSHSAEKAARIANTIAEIYVAEQLSDKAGVAERATGLLDERLESLRRRVAEAEHNVEKYKAQQNIFAAEGKILSERELGGLAEQSVLARNRTAELRARVERVRELQGTGPGIDAVADVLSNLTTNSLKGKIAEASRQRAELATRYGSRHPEMIKVEAELRDTRNQLHAEVMSLIAGLENEYAEARARQADLLGSLNAMKKDEIERRSANVKLNELEREAETSRQIYEVLLTRFKENAASQTLQLPDARIVEFADTPLFPSAPKRKQIVALATAGGFALALALALALEFSSPGIGRPEDAEQLLELEHISSLPRLVYCEDEPEDKLRTTRLMVAEPTGAFAEAIRAMRREIDIRQDHDGPRVVLVAASLPGEGASVVASNLAHYYALTGDRILLIDADLRRSNLSRQLAPQRHGGIAETLAGATRPEDAILRDQLTNLHFLPATSGGPMSSGQAELLTSPKFPDLLRRLKGQFDVIVIDAPPLLPVIDTRIIADHADQIVFVMAWRRTPKQLARKAMKLLNVNADRIAGVVVNQVDSDVLSDDTGLQIIDGNGGREPGIAA